MNLLENTELSDKVADAAGKGGVMTGASVGTGHYMGWLQSVDIAWWGTAFSIIGVTWMVFAGLVRLYWEYQDRKWKQYSVQQESDGDMENAE